MSTAIFTFTRFKKINLILLIGLLTVSCDLFYDEGEWKTEQRFLPSYEALTIESVSEVYYHYSDTFSVEIHYYDKHLSDIKTKINDNTLTIQNNFSGQIYTDIRNPEIHIYAPTLQKINVVKEIGAGFFCLDTIVNSSFDILFEGDLVESNTLINCESLNISINKSAGYFTLEGRANNCIFSNKGETTINAKELQINFLDITHQSSLDAIFTVTDQLDYRILRSGDLIVWGNPSANGEILGTGKLILK